MPTSLRCLHVLVFVLGACHEPLGQGSPAPEVPGSVFTIAVLPDTQGYAQGRPEIYEDQTAWLAREKDNLNLTMVVHEGDLVEASWDLEQWDSARAAMSLLDGQVPYIIAPGNHDYGRTYEERNSRSRTTHLDTYFPQELFLSMPTFGGFFEDGVRTDNSYQLFEHAGQRWLVLALEFGPRQHVLLWANEVLSAYSDHLAIVVTHAYLYPDGARYDWERLGSTQLFNPKSYPLSDQGSTDGQDIWDTVIRRHANVVAVLCGHALDDGVAYRVSYGLGEVHEILANYQMNRHGGDGYLRLMQFDTATSQVHVSTYSPWRDSFKRDPDNQFSFDYSSHVTE